MYLDKHFGVIGLSPITQSVYSLKYKMKQNSKSENNGCDKVLSNQSHLSLILQPKESIRDASESITIKSCVTHIVKPRRAAEEGSNTCQAISTKP